MAKQGVGMTNIYNAVVDSPDLSDASIGNKDVHIPPIKGVTRIAPVNEQEQLAPGKSLVPVHEIEKTHLNLVNTLQEKLNSLPVLYDFNRVVSASHLLSHRFQLPYSQESYEKTRRELSTIMLGTIVFIFTSIVTWGMSTEINFLNGGDFIYNTGLIGGILMLMTLVHSLIKRFSVFNSLLSTTHSYYFHVFCGAIGALFIVVHSSFDFRSINSSVAMVSMMLILVAGAFGRYLYTYFTLSLHKLYVEVSKTEQALFFNISKYNCNTAKQVRAKLSKIAFRSLSPSKNATTYLARAFTSAPYALYIYISSLLDIFRIVDSATVLGDFEKEEIKKIKISHEKEIRQYVYNVTKMGYLNLFEQVFRNWRVLHVPFLYILTLTAIVHVIVVHMY